MKKISSFKHVNYLRGIHNKQTIEQSNKYEPEEKLYDEKGHVHCFSTMKRIPKDTRAIKQLYQEQPNEHLLRASKQTRETSGDRKTLLKLVK